MAQDLPDLLERLAAILDRSTRGTSRPSRRTRARRTRRPGRWRRSSPGPGYRWRRDPQETSRSGAPGSPAARGPALRDLPQPPCGRPPLSPAITAPGPAPRSGPCGRAWQGLTEGSQLCTSRRTWSWPSCLQRRVVREMPRASLPLGRRAALALRRRAARLRLQQGPGHRHGHPSERAGDGRSGVVCVSAWCTVSGARTVAISHSGRPLLCRDIDSVRRWCSPGRSRAWGSRLSWGPTVAPGGPRSGATRRERSGRSAQGPRCARPPGPRLRLRRRAARLRLQQGPGHRHGHL
ncbi:hypothetical protein Ae717Ps2_6346c [Pseudonocardia sp. Ae717_Ps2]|nr:hypothetical protein Ae717Ps2_6346c [Pseudonocardia sp. Ae717_Ps2]